MAITLSRCFVEFNHCRFGLADTPPRIVIDPESFASETDGGCRIAAARRVVLQLGLELLDAGFSRLLDRAGRPVRLTPEATHRSGTLLLTEVGPEGFDATGALIRARARLLPGAGYRPFAGHDRRLVMEFALSMPDSGNYLELL